MSAPRIAAIVLAAGRSTRMGAVNKLSLDIGGAPMVRHVVEAALASQARPVVAVVGHEQHAVRGAIGELAVGVVENPAYATGLASSLKAGIVAVSGQCDGAVVLLGDMPQITSAHIDRLIAAYAPGAIIVPTHLGKRGNPVLWSSDYFAEIGQLDGDTGAKQLLIAHADQVREIDLGSDAIFLDIDTPDALARVRDRDTPNRG